MLVLVRLLFVFVLRMLMPVRLMIFSVFVLMTVGVLMRMTVLDVAVPVFMVMRVGVLVFVFHDASARKYICSESRRGSIY
jgi:hypothetical protein